MLSGLEPGERLVVAVDQLEELFTVCEHEDERAAFLDQLAAGGARPPSGGCDRGRALRADFYGRCAPYTAFRGAAQPEPRARRADGREELAQAIEQPAARAGLVVERALVDDAGRRRRR